MNIGLFSDLSKIRAALHSLQWRHNGCDGVSNHQHLHCLLNWGSGAEKRKHLSSVSLVFVSGFHRWPRDKFPAQKASNVESVSIWLRHHVGQQNKMHICSPPNVRPVEVNYTLRNTKCLVVKINASFHNNSSARWQCYIVFTNHTQIYTIRYTQAFIIYRPRCLKLKIVFICCKFIINQWSCQELGLIYWYDRIRFVWSTNPK